MGRFLAFLVVSTCFTLTLQNLEDNNVEDNVQMYAEMASEFLKNPNAEGMSGILNSFIQSGGGKQLVDVLSNLGSNGNANEILKNLGSIVNQEDDRKESIRTGEEEGRNRDEGGLGTIVSSVLSSLASKDKKPEDLDLIGMFSWFAENLGGATGQNVWEYLPMFLSTLGSFTGEEAHSRELEHEKHAWFMPPIVEKVHVFYDHFVHSEMGRAFLKYLGTDKLVKIFADKEGNFSYEKFSELIENHSFRKHWIELVTRRIASFVAYFADPEVQKRFGTTAQYMINNFLKGQGFPRSTLIDLTRPSESITAAVNHIFKKYFSYKVSSKQYVKPAVQYVQEVLGMAQKRGIIMGSGINSRELSHKIADTVNLEVIEPVARVLRGYRFIKKRPECDKYVMCLVNQPSTDQAVSLPGLKQGLSVSTSLVASWFATSTTGTPYWTFYSIIAEEEPGRCQNYYSEICNEFHLEELKVTTEYVHNEL